MAVSYFAERESHASLCVILTLNSVALYVSDLVVKLDLFGAVPVSVILAF